MSGAVITTCQTPGGDWMALADGKPVMDLLGKAPVLFRSERGALFGGWWRTRLGESRLMWCNRERHQ